MLRSLLTFVAAAVLSMPALASESAEAVQHLNATSSLAGYLAVFIFAIAYIVVVLEEKLQLRKSKPVLLAAGTYLVINWHYQPRPQRN